MLLNKISSFVFVLLLFCSSPSFAQDNKKEAKELLDKFLTAWLIEQDIDRAVTYVAVQESTSDISRMFNLDPAGFDIELWLRKTLTMWLEKDHGLVNNWGHGDPKHPGYINIPAKPADLKSRLNLMVALPEVTLDEMDLRNHIAGPDAEAAYIASFKFDHAPRDGVVILLIKTSTGWKLLPPLWIVA